MKIIQIDRRGFWNKVGGMDNMSKHSHDLNEKIFSQKEYFFLDKAGEYQI